LYTTQASFQDDGGIWELACNSGGPGWRLRSTARVQPVGGQAALT
jgi:hypothetical protein